MNAFVIAGSQDKYSRARGQRQIKHASDPDNTSGPGPQVEHGLWREHDSHTAKQWILLCLRCIQFPMPSPEHASLRVLPPVRGNMKTASKYHVKTMFIKYRDS